MCFFFRKIQYDKHWYSKYRKNTLPGSPNIHHTKSNITKCIIQIHAIRTPNHSPQLHQPTHNSQINVNHFLLTDLLNLWSICSDIVWTSGCDISFSHKYLFSGNLISCFSGFFFFEKYNMLIKTLQDFQLCTINI